MNTLTTEHEDHLRQRPAFARLRRGACALTILVCGGVLVACGGARHDVVEDGPLVEGQGPGIDPYAPRFPGESRGELERSAVDAVLQAGPQAFISKVKVVPASVDGRFVGFRLEEFFPGEDRFREVDLHPGDIILRVNGHPVEQPGDFMKIWQELGVAQQLRVEYLRGALVRVLEWKIVDRRALQPTLIP